jgi:hypothetical protein
LSFTPEVARNFTIEDLKKLKEHGVEISEEELTKLQSEEVVEEKKPGFFSRLFPKFKNKKKENSEEIPLEEESAEIPEDDEDK